MQSEVWGEGTSSPPLLDYTVLGDSSTPPPHHYSQQTPKITLWENSRSLPSPAANSAVLGSNLSREARSVRPELRPNLRARENESLLPTSQDSGEGSHPGTQSTGKATPPQPARPRWERESRWVSDAQRAPLLPDFSAAPVGGALPGARISGGQSTRPTSVEIFPGTAAGAGNQDLYNLAAGGAGRDRALFS